MVTTNYFTGSPFVEIDSEYDDDEYQTWYCDVCNKSHMDEEMMRGCESCYKTFCKDCGCEECMVFCKECRPLSKDGCTCTNNCCEIHQLKCNFCDLPMCSQCIGKYRCENGDLLLCNMCDIDLTQGDEFKECSRCGDMICTACKDCSKNKYIDGKCNNCIVTLKKFKNVSLRSRRRLSILSIGNFDLD